MYYYMLAKGISLDPKENQKGEYDNILYQAIDNKWLGLLHALLAADVIKLSESFISFYQYFLENAMITTTLKDYPLKEKYTEKEILSIKKAMEKKIEFQKKSGFFDPQKMITLKQEDYFILHCGLKNYYDCLTDSEKYVFEDNEELNNLRDKLSESTKLYKGPFFNMPAKCNARTYFLEYDSFEKYREEARYILKQKKKRK